MVERRPADPQGRSREAPGRRLLGGNSFLLWSVFITHPGWRHGLGHQRMRFAHPSRPYLAWGHVGAVVYCLTLAHLAARFPLLTRPRRAGQLSRQPVLAIRAGHASKKQPFDSSQFLVGPARLLWYDWRGPVGRRRPMPFRFHAVTAIFALATLAATGSARAESGFQEVDATLSAAQESVQACSAEAAALASTRARLRNVTLPVVGKLIVVNVAGQVLTGYRDGMPEIEMRVIVGRTDRQTAELQTEVSFVRVNPSARLGCVPAQGLGDQRPLGRCLAPAKTLYFGRRCAAREDHTPLPVHIMRYRTPSASTRPPISSMLTRLIVPSQHFHPPNMSRFEPLSRTTRR